VVTTFQFGTLAVMARRLSCQKVALSERDIRKRQNAQECEECASYTVVARKKMKNRNGY
jgi:hypothetical protein